MKHNSFCLTVIFVSLLFFSFTDSAHARDFSSGVQSLGGDVKSVLMVLGPVMLMVAGGMFYFSRHFGISMLMSAALGTVLFAASSTLFTLLYRAFS